ncbi:MAG TPA: circadian clock KaiB family protein [Methylomirabilota bacterium]|nr:circadian clock KaiB family protein [Methylomirabilota bacterium]
MKPSAHPVRGLLFVTERNKSAAIEAAREGAKLCNFPAAIEVYDLDKNTVAAEEWDIVAVPTLVLHRPPQSQRRVVGKFDAFRASQALDAKL